MYRKIGEEMKYTILDTKYSETPYFCLTAAGLRILKLICAIENYCLCEWVEEDDELPLQEFLKTEKWQNYFEEFYFEEYWEAIYGCEPFSSEEPVESWYDDEDLISFYAFGKLELSDLILGEHFEFEEQREPPPPLIVQDEKFQYNYWIMLIVLIIAITAVW